MCVTKVILSLETCRVTSRFLLSISSLLSDWIEKERQKVFQNYLFFRVLELRTKDIWHHTNYSLDEFGENVNLFSFPCQRKNLVSKPMVQSIQRKRKEIIVRKRERMGSEINSKQKICQSTVVTFFNLSWLKFFSPFNFFFFFSSREWEHFFESHEFKNISSWNIGIFALAPNYFPEKGVEDKELENCLNWRGSKK